MRITERLIGIGIGLAVLFWILESAIHVFIFHEGGFMQQVFGPPAHEIWMRLFVVALFVAFGVYGQAIIIRRRQAEEATKHAYGELNQIFNTAADGMRLIDRDFNILRVNETFSRLSGVAEEEAIGRKCHEVFRGRLCHSPGCPLTRILRGDDHIECDVEKERYDGNSVPCIVTAMPFQDVSGELIGIVEDFRDITERKEAEEAVLRAKNDWENTFDAITDHLMLLDNEHRIIRVNRAGAEALNATKENLVGKRCYEAIHGQNRPIKGCPLALTMERLAPHTVEITEPNLGGTFICSTSPIMDHEGKLTGYTHGLKDITESKRLEAQLQQAQKMEAIGTLAGGIAHDFNNLLTGIQGNVSLVLMNMDSADPHHKRLKKVEKQIETGATLTSRLLGYARKGKYDVKPIDLNELVEETSEAFGMTKKDITVHLDLAKDLSVIEADHGQMEQVLLNLFVNAGDAMADGGDLVIKTMNATHDQMKRRLHNPRGGNYVLLKVTDNGTGMDKATMKRVFDPFFTTKEMGHGTGLGLASAYGIVKGHGGCIEIDSEKGQGTTFSIYLPASGKQVEGVVKTADEAMKGTETVLLVDDEEGILEVGRDLLKAMGYRVLLARDGKEAVDVYREKHDDIDVVLLDVVMPNMGGRQTYDRMKEINPEIKVLLSSGYSVDGTAHEMLKRGCNSFIQKPFDARALSGRIRDILDKG
jgi:PAS domain S-box-containing protein